MAGLYLRLPVLVAPPLAPLIDADLGLSQVQLGALTTLPVLMLSLGAIPGALAIARLGPRLALIVAILMVAITSMARGLAPPVWILFLNTTLLGLGIAVMQPALPSLVLRWCPGFLALGSAVYMNGMLMGEFIGAGLTLPLLMPFLDDDWRTALVFWSLPAIAVAGLIYVSKQLGIRETESEAPGPTPWKPPLNRARTWHLGIILGTSSSGFFGTNAYLSTLLDSKGTLEELPNYLFVFNGAQILGSLGMLVLARFWVGRRLPVILMAWATLLGLFGIVLAEGMFAAGAATVVGLATCIQLILMVALVPQIADSRDASSLAAGVFMVGYFLGFAVPGFGGLVADIVSDARAAFIPIATLAAMGVALAHASPYLNTKPTTRDS
ncbi:MAG: MFS transporter [Pseudomonadales bacterium]